MERYASSQSEVVDSRDTLESRCSTRVRCSTDEVPRPAWWGGYRVVPDEFEFWQGRPSRLHDRVPHLRQGGATWHRERLAP